MDGFKHGFGRWKKSTSNSANLYEGQYANDKKEGFGIFKWASGNKYIGHYKNDKREGIGQMVWTDGSFYIGEWKEGIQHGYGCMYFPDGSVKEGLFDKNNYKGPIDPDTYNVPKELQDKAFDIMRYAKDMKFSDEILGKKPSASYSTSANKRKTFLRSSKALSVNQRNNRFAVNSGKISESAIEEVEEKGRRKLKRRRFRRRKFRPKGDWIPSGKPNYADISRIPGGI